MRTLARLLALTAAYAALGRLALLLAIPPGYATAVWPAAGVALVGVVRWGPRVAPGVALGSFLVNAGTSSDGSLVGIAVPAMIALGATGQALFGATLLRRRGTAALALEEPRDILALVVDGALLACAVSATVGVATLALAGRVPTGELAFSWLTWWVGDAIGCMVFAPLVLLLANRAAARRCAVVGGPLLVGFAMVTVLYVVVSGWEQQRRHDAFAHRATAVANAVEGSLHDASIAVTAVAGLFGGTAEVRDDDFRAFVTPQLAQIPALIALGWNPRVGDADRARFEAAARTRDPGYAITEHAPDGRLHPAARRAAYVPITLLEPPTVEARGFDITSEPVRAEAVARATATRAPAASGVVALLQGNEGVLLLIPDRRPGPDHGFGVGVIGLERALASATTGLDVAGLDLALVDVTDGTPRPLVGAPARAPWVRRELGFGGRRWALLMTPGPSAREAARGWAAWTVLAAGLLGVAMIGSLTLLVTGRATIAERAAQRLQEAERAQRLLLELGEIANRAEREDQVRDAAVLALSRHLQATRCGFDLVEADADRATILADSNAGDARAVGATYRLSDFSASTQATLRDGRSVVNHDVARDPRTAARFDAIYRPRALGSFVIVPLFRDGVWCGALWVSQDRPRTWSSEEVRLIDDVATKTWLWGEQLRLTRELRALNLGLEQQVAERTGHLDAALREREVLLKEIHHRVKNNLQVISSLLGLQAHHVTEPQVRIILEESRARVHAIALVHEQLYRSNNLADVALGSYASDLIANLSTAHGGTTRGVTVRVDSDGVRVPVSTAIACGLIISELVSNSFKHAFPGARPGTITVTMTQVEGQLEVVVADDGVGLPAGLDPRHAGGLGLELVRTFVEQLQGTITYAGPGTRATLRFPPPA